MAFLVTRHTTRQVLNRLRPAKTTSDPFPISPLVCTRMASLRFTGLTTSPFSSTRLINIQSTQSNFPYYRPFGPSLGQSYHGFLQSTYVVSVQRKTAHPVKLRARHLSHDARPAFAFLPCSQQLLSTSRWTYIIGTNLRRRSDSMLHQRGR